MKELRGKTAIVTGAGSGIGAAAAAEFCAQGMNVVIADIREGPLEAVRSALATGGGRVRAIPVDISDSSSVEALAQESVKAFGDVHLAFNNAGVPMHGTPLVDISLADWDWVVDVNIRGLIHCIRAFTPLLLKHGENAHIVNTASIGGFQVNPAWLTGAYSMTKYAAVALSEAMNQELAATSVRVTVLCPGAVATDFGKSDSRPTRFGGPTDRPQQAFLNQAISAGIRPQRVAKLVVKAVVDEQFFVFTDSVLRPAIEARHADICRAFDRADRLAAEYADEAGHPS